MIRNLDVEALEIQNLRDTSLKNFEIIIMVCNDENKWALSVKIIAN